jgi:putative hydrolase of the HAD superfamily
VDLLGVVLDDLGVLSQTPEPLDDLVPVLRAAGLRTAVLSNAPRVRAGLPEVDAVLVSGATGLTKPDPAAYAGAAAALRLAPAQCVVVDDLVRNVRGAASAGCVGVLHRTRRDTLAELAVLLGDRATIAGWPTA